MCTSKRKAGSVALCPVWECMVLLVLLDGESRIVGFCTLEISVEGLTVTLNVSTTSRSLRLRLTRLDV